MEDLIRGNTVSRVHKSVKYSKYNNMEVMQALAKVIYQVLVVQVEKRKEKGKGM